MFTMNRPISAMPQKLQVNYCIVDSEVERVCPSVLTQLDCPRGRQAIKNRPRGDLYV